MKNFKKTVALALSVIMLISAAPLAFAQTDIDYEITSPYESLDFDSLNQYKADLHSHTTFSDGHETLPAMVQRHYELGFDIYAMSDHGTTSKGYTTQEFNDPLKLISWVKNGDVYDDVLNPNGQVSDGVTYRVEMNPHTDDEYYIETANGTDGQAMLRVPFAIEQNPTSFNNAHVNSWFVDYGDGVLGGTSYYEAPISEIDSLGGLSVINHPGEYTNARDEETEEAAYNLDDPVYKYKIDMFTKILLDYEFCIGIDINSKGDSRTRYDRKLWDILLQRTIPNGRNIYAIASSDAHNLDIVDSGYTIMLMPSNTSANLKTSLSEGQFFAASKYIGNMNDIAEYKAIAEKINTPEAQLLTSMLAESLAENDKFYAGENAVTPVIRDIAIDEQGDIISIEAENAVVIRWIADGEEIHVGSSIDLDDYSDKIGSYVRAEIVGPGGIIYTQAFMLDYEGAPTAESFDNVVNFGSVISLICDTIVKALPYILPLKLIFAIAGK